MGRNYNLTHTHTPCAILAFAGLSPQAHSLTHLLPVFSPPQLQPHSVPSLSLSLSISPLTLPSPSLPSSAPLDLCSPLLWSSLAQFFIISSPLNSFSLLSHPFSWSTQHSSRSGVCEQKPPKKSWEWRGGGGCEYTYINIFVPVIVIFVSSALSSAFSTY